MGRYHYKSVLKAIQMELSGIMNSIIASPFFSAAMIIAIIIGGIAIRLLLIPTNNEYKHRPDKE